MPSKHGSLINVRLDRETMAVLAGTVPETLSRVLTEFQNDGVIRREGRQIHVRDLPQLTKVAES